MTFTSLLRLSLSALILIAAATLLAPSSATAQGAKIGSLSAVTGPIPELVADIVASEEQAVKEINAAGGVLGGDLEMVLADSQCDAKAAVDAATKLVNVDQVTAIVGAICSGGTIGAVQAVTIPAGVVSVSPSATSPAITDLEDNDLVYRVAPSDAYQGVTLAKLAYEAGYRKMALTYTNDDYNTGIGNVFRQAFVGMGGEITNEQLHEPNKPSYRSELATLAGGGADALALFAYYDGSGITIIRQSLENGFFDKFIAADGMLNDSVITEIGADALSGNIFFTAAASEEDTDSFKRFTESMAEIEVSPTAPYVAQGYDAVMLVALAIQHAGSTDRDMIARSLREVASGPGEKIGPGDWAKAVRLLSEGKAIDYVGAAGSHDFDENGDVAGVFNRHDVSASGELESMRVE